MRCDQQIQLGSIHPTVFKDECCKSATGHRIWRWDRLSHTSPTLGTALAKKFNRNFATQKILPQPRNDAPTEMIARRCRTHGRHPPPIPPRHSFSMPTGRCWRLPRPPDAVRADSGLIGTLRHCRAFPAAPSRLLSGRGSPISTASSRRSFCPPPGSTVWSGGGPTDMWRRWRTRRSRNCAAPWPNLPRANAASFSRIRACPLALHYRGAPEREGSGSRLRARTLLGKARRRPSAMLEGKKVVEFPREPRRQGACDRNLHGRGAFSGSPPGLRGRRCHRRGRFFVRSSGLVASGYASVRPVRARRRIGCRRSPPCTPGCAKPATTTT